MVDAKELRIGNWVYLELGLPSLDIHKIKSPDISSIEKDSKNVLPIPLTTDILLGCGFECSSKGFYTHSDWFNISLKYRNGTYDLRCNFMDRIATNIDYVHQLQNLYYALTQKELVINL